MDARYQRWFGKPDETWYKVALYRFGIVNGYHFEDWTYKCHDPCPETSESALVSAYVDNDMCAACYLCAPRVPTRLTSRCVRTCLAASGSSTSAPTGLGS